jgi:hypothetical protein
MYRYKSWTSAAAHPVASNDEVRSTVSSTPPTLSRSRSLPPIAPPLNVPPRTSLTQSITPRRPQVGREVVPNPFRPHVAAADRIRCWKTPHSISFNLQMASALPPDLIESSFETIYGSLAPATKSTYGAGLLRFTQFCDKYEIPESDRMPASFLLLVAFISEHVGSVSGKTIRGWLSGLKAWHDTYHAEWCGDDRWLQMARVTANKEGTAFRLKRRDPVTLDHLLTLYEGLDLTSPAHAACWAIAACSFWGVRRFVFLLHMHQCHLTFP